MKDANLSIFHDDIVISKLRAKNILGYSFKNQKNFKFQDIA